MAIDFVNKFEAAYGPKSRNQFAGHAYDFQVAMEKAIPLALKKAKPGTPEFRAAMRDAIEQLKGFVGTEGVYNMSPQDHNGVDERSQVMIKIENGKWVYQP